MISLRGVGKDFGTVRALREIDLDIAAGTIHGIIGENGAGKSTLMKILTGFIGRTRGTIRIEGREVALASPREARELGIGMLYQEPLDFPRLSVLDNFMAAAADGSVNRQRRFLARLCQRFGFSLNPDQSQEKLTVGERQQVELMRLIRDGCRILILDEPTTGISSHQQEILFAALDDLRGQGHAILLVSHKLEEIHALCDRVSVLRRGRLTDEQDRPFDENRLLAAMFQSLPETLSPPPPVAPGPVVVRLRDVVSRAGRTGLDRVSVTIGEGEIVGLAGLDGSGQSLFLRMIHGLLTPESGEVEVTVPGDDRVMRVFLPADRLRDGLIAGLSIREHHLLAAPSPLFIGPASGQDRARRAIDTYTILGTAETPADDLSGGNQQRLLLSLIPATARLILLEHPTRGLDVQSAQWTWRHLRSRLPANGALVFASPDLDEIMRQASRILVFFEGRIVLDRRREQTTPEEISRAITGQTDDPARAGGTP